jgi:hypothetical protein
MWDDFNPSHNTFILALNRLRGREYSGYSLKTLPSKVQPLVTIFGPFGNNWKKIKGKKIFYTGENRGPINHPEVLNVGFQHSTHLSYLRLPFWMLSIDLFGADLSKIKNPLPLPIHTCSETPFLSLHRSKFCAFIVSNSKNKVRNSAFHALSKYKKVDSAGKLFNTEGNALFAGAGGGGGELKKHEFLKQYRFCLAYENEIGNGYVTEKLLHAKAAGCVPIYWGSDSAITDFNPLGFINATYLTEEQMVQRVREIEENPDLWKEIASVPLFYSDTLSSVYEKFKEIADYICPQLSSLPENTGSLSTTVLI